ncbi:MAG: TorF family putative porin [Colwellia sp.]
MKKTLISIALTSLFALSSTVSTKAFAEEESGLNGVEGLSANVAVVSQYFFRGIAQTDSASASAGLDYELGNFSVGTWVADVSDGLEVDFYGSYGFEFDGGFGLSAGFTSYQYTGDFDTSYNEINLGASFSFVSVTYNVGVHEVEGASDSDYDFITVTGEYEGFYATYGSWGQDFDGDYFELGYGTSVSGFDIGVAAIINSKELDVEGAAEGDESLVFSIAKSF